MRLRRSRFSRAPLFAIALVALLATVSRGADPVQIPAGRAIAEIGGTWKFQPGDDAAWASPDYDDSAWADVRVPGSWVDQGFEAHVGFAWYRVWLDIPAGYPLHHLAVTLKTVTFSSFEVYAGGQLVGGRGAQPPSARIVAPRTVVCVVAPSAVDGRGRLLLAVRVWQHPETAGTIHRRGGIDVMPLFGDGDALVAAVRAAEHGDDGAQIPVLALVLVFTVVGFYHLQLFRRRRESAEYLWFGVFALLMATNMFGVSRWIFTVIESPFAARRIVDFSTHMAMAACIQFTVPVLDRPIGRVLRAFQLANVAMAVFLVLSPDMHFAMLSQPWRIVAFLPCLFGLIWMMVHAAWNGNADARTVSIGFAGLLVAEILHVFRLLGVQGIPFLPPWGFAAVVFSMAVSLANRFSRVHDELDALNRDLEAKVAQRTAELAASERKALEANQAKSTFLANMSHELRTPLNAVLGFAQLMERDGGRSESDCESLAVIRRSGEHLLGLINDVLSLSKIEAGKLTLHTRPFDLRRMLLNTESMVRPRAEAAGLALAFEVEPSVPSVVDGDDQKLRQVLVNLLGNAVKFTQRGQVTMRARWREGRATFDVEDTGVGISAEEIRNLFEAFVQTESGRQSKEGTGLGLVISRQFIRLMGGDIQIRSEQGKGTVFSFDIELGHTSQRDPERKPQRVVGLAHTETPPRILVVDDTPENRTLMVRLLTGVGFDVREAADGAQAVQIWQQWRPALVFMDMRMPVMDGKQAVRRIRELEAEGSGNRTVIAALTASAFEHERAEILACGADDFVAKPYREETIFERLAEHLGISFRYEEPTGPAAQAAHRGGVLTAERMAAIPFVEVVQLHKALVSGDLDDAVVAVEQMRRHDEALGLDLLKALRKFEFDELLSLIEQIEPCV